MKQNGYLKEAKRLCTYAKNEYQQAKRKKNEVKTRQAAEKGYLSLMKAVNALFVSKGMQEDKVPKGERGRLHLLGKYTDREFRKTYDAIRHSLHIDAFHEGIIEYKILDERFEDLDALIKEVETAS